VLGLACFASSATNQFAYDDQPLIVDNPRIRNLTDFRALWLSDWWKLAESGPESNPRRDRLYRPLTLFSLALNYAVHGYRPLGYHVANIALHAAVCLLVWQFARRLVQDEAVATVAAVLFAVHPVHAEAVANVVGRAEVLAALFLLLGLLVMLPRRGPAGAGPRRRGDAAVPAGALVEGVRGLLPGGGAAGTVVRAARRAADMALVGGCAGGPAASAPRVFPVALPRAGSRAVSR
jgi:hypothetical protein